MTDMVQGKWKKRKSSTDNAKGNGTTADRCPIVGFSAFSPVVLLLCHRTFFSNNNYNNCCKDNIYAECVNQHNTTTRRADFL